MVLGENTGDTLSPFLGLLVNIEGRTGAKISAVSSAVVVYIIVYLNYNILYTSFQSLL